MGSTNELDLKASLDRDKVPFKNLETELKCLVRVWPTLDETPVTAPMNVGLCLVFDCSSSMLAQGKLEAAIDSAKMIVDMIPKSYSLSLVAFQSSIHVLVLNAKAEQESCDSIKEQIDEIRTIAGGSTNMADAIKEGLKALQRGKVDSKIMILLSDGAADNPKFAEQAALEATKAGVQIFTVGVGDKYVAEQLLKISNPSNGALFGASDVSKLKDVFSSLIQRIEHFVATNVKLHATFHPEVQAGLAYKASPEQAFLGNMVLSPTRTAEFNIGNVEKEKLYSFLFLLSVPQRDPGVLEAATLVLTYDIPAAKIVGERRTASVSVEYVKDRRAAEAVDGKVMETFRRVSLAQVTDKFVKAYKDKKNEDAAKYLQILIKRHDEVGDVTMKNHYETILNELKSNGSVTDDMLNTAVVASTVVSNSGELPQLVDDSF